jgi:hypothetical protein
MGVDLPARNTATDQLPYHILSRSAREIRRNVFRKSVTTQIASKFYEVTQINQRRVPDFFKGFFALW